MNFVAADVRRLILFQHNSQSLLTAVQGHNARQKSEDSPLVSKVESAPEEMTNSTFSSTEKNAAVKSHSRQARLPLCLSAAWIDSRLERQPRHPLF